MNKTYTPIKTHYQGYFIINKTKAVLNCTAVDFSCKNKEYKQRNIIFCLYANETASRGIHVKYCFYFKQK